MARRTKPPALELRTLAESFRRSLSAQNKSSSTISIYVSAVALLAGHLASRKRPTTIDAITRRDIEAFIAHLLEHYKPNTAANRYRALQAFFRWALEEGEVDESPMRNMRPPQVPEVPGSRRRAGPRLSTSRPHSAGVKKPTKRVKALISYRSWPWPLRVD